MNGFTTRLLHTYYRPDQKSGDIIPPLHLSTTFQFGNEGQYEYSRSGNPTREILEHTLAALDKAQYGLAFSSGSAVLATITAMLRPKEKILFSTDAYGGTYRFIVQVAGKQGIGSHIADLTDPQEVEKILRKENIRLIWLETPSNPLLKIADIEALAKLARQYTAWLVVDNTFATPILQQPLQWGADMVVYSTTKYMNGHSDSVGGALTTNSKTLYEKLKYLQNAIGAMLSPFDAWLTLRGLRTLELRMERHVDNAQKIADFLSKHPKVKRTYYPGLLNGGRARIVHKQMQRPGAMISIEIAESYDVQKFIKALKLFPLAESLGGIESLLDHPASMTHAAIPPEERRKIGLSDGLFRISVGIENAQDLLDDLEQALEML